jgi:MAP3K TRAFs-binding domain
MMPKRFCFMIMPFGKKPTQAEAGPDIPAVIDFDALWDQAYAPTIESLDYKPVRADQDTGALIIKQMMERLYFADLVLAEMTIPNGNVYYEVGIRHASQKTGCVLLAAKWSKQLFDVDQMRMVRYPLSEGAITEATATAISDAIKDPIQRLSKGTSPMHDSIVGYPAKVDPATASVMKDAMTELASFQGQVRALRALPFDERMPRAKELVETYWKPDATQLTAVALLRMLQNSVSGQADWAWLADFIDKLPPEVASLEEAREIDALAVSKAGKQTDAIAKLQTLIELSGPTPERLGLLGGRYKQLYFDAKRANQKSQAQHLNNAIDAYERGMELDLNDYYCSSNLPRLYRQRKSKGDDERARSVSTLIVAACERAKKRGLADEWLRPTLLGAAFDAGDCDKVEELAEQVLAEGGARWRLESTSADLRSSLPLLKDDVRRDRLAAVLDRLTSASA